jgi:16S rRNA (cytosine967-C5)-methyltransferase
LKEIVFLGGNLTPFILMDNPPNVLFGWQKLVVQAAGHIMYDPSLPAERIVKKTLRSGESYLNNVERRWLARKLYGVCSLRARLEYIALQTLADYESFDNQKKILCLISIYTFHEEKTYFQDLNSPWLEYSNYELGSHITEQIIANCVDDIVWPTKYIDALSATYSLPRWISITILDSFANYDDSKSFANSLNIPGSPVFRTNLCKITRENLAMQLESIGINTTPTFYSSAGLRVLGNIKPEIRNNPLNKSGYFEVQDEGSQLIALSTGATSNSLVIDLCCGRGGKALHLADIMQLTNAKNSGMLICHDIDHETLSHAKRRFDKVGITSENNVKFICSRQLAIVNGGRGGDKSKNVTECHESLDVAGIINIIGGFADIVLVDAPCSSLGTLRRGPNVRWEMTSDALLIFPKLQKNILNEAVCMVKPGGLLVYATCTFNNSECIDIKHWFEKEYSEFSSVPLIDVFGSELLRKLLPNLNESQIKIVDHVQLRPDVHKSDAFFICRWIRNIL